jgi:hypothetical protein
MHFRRYLLVLPALAALVLLAAIAPADPTTAPVEGVVLLRTGRVIAGKIRRDGQRYLVAVTSGEVSLRPEQVEQICATLADGYQYKRRGLLPGNTNSHLDLAAWCIANGLWTEGQRELDQARRLEPRHPKIELLERRLATDRQAALSPEPASPTDAVVKPVATAEEVLDVPLLISKQAMESFTTVVQPILQNHCSAASCHGPTTTSNFRLVRLPYGRLANQRITQQNLRAVLPLVDREDPSKSALLMTPIRPHGTARIAVFRSGDTAKYQQLVAWVQQVADGKTNVAEKRSAAQPPLLQTDVRADQGPTAPGSSAQHSPGSPPLLPAAFRNAEDKEESERVEQVDSADLPSFSGLPTSPGEGTAKQRRPSLNGFVPRDAFDPEIFNRRYFPGHERR